MAANDDLGNFGRKSPTNRGDEKVALLRETTEALTALGNYIAVVQREFDKHPGLTQEVLGEALQKSLGQYQRAAEALRRLHEIFLRRPKQRRSAGH